MRRQREVGLSRKGTLLLPLYSRDPEHVNPMSDPSRKISTHFQMMKFSAGLYFAFPTPTFASAFVVFNGVGILSTTLLAFNFGSKLARRWIVYSTRDFVGSVTCVCNRKGRLMFDVERYRMSSNSPSGGMKLIDRSESNLPRRTHWWNWQSSSSTALSDFGALPSLRNVSVTATAAS